MGNKAAAAAAAKSSPIEIVKGDKLGRQGGSGSQEQPRTEITNGDKSSPEWRSGRETNEGRQGGQRQPRAAHNGNHEGTNAMKGD